MKFALLPRFENVYLSEMTQTGNDQVNIYDSKF